MKYLTHNQKKINVGGTCLVGEIVVSYKILKRVFGQPTGSDGYKSDAEWEIEFEDGEVATIYNYKDGKNYNGRSGLPKTKITNWHIGGKDKEVVERIEILINEIGGFDK